MNENDEVYTEIVIINDKIYKNSAFVLVKCDSSLEDVNSKERHKNPITQTNASKQTSRHHPSRRTPSSEIEVFDND